MPLSVPCLLAITDRRSLPGGDLMGWLDALALAGFPAVQLREKDLDDRALYDLATQARAAFPPPGQLLINARADVARAVGADGVHLPAAGLPIAALREWLGPELLVGRSTHSPEEAREAAAQGADYVTFGPVYPTPSKAAYGPPPGLPALSQAAGCGIPVLALGGVTLPRLGEVAASGASGAAGIRVFQRTEDLPKILARGRESFTQPQEDG